MGAGDHLIGDPAEELWNLESATDRYRALVALQMQTTEEQAINANNFSRFYITPSQELVSAVALSGIEWDYSGLADVVQAERDEAWSPFRAAGSIARATVRNTFMSMDSLIDQTWSRPFRIAEQLLQNDDIDFWEAYDRSGQPELSQTIRAFTTGQGGNVHTGSGWVPSRYDPAEDPKVAEEFLSRMQRLNAAGQGLAGQTQIWDDVLADMAPQMPYDVVARAGDTAEATRFNVKMPDGTMEQTGVSLGRFLSNRLANVGGLTIVRPNTAPATLISGAIDAYVRVGTDPLNIPADALSDFMRAKKYVIPDAGKGVGRNVARKKALEMSNDWRWWVSPRTIDKWAETRPGRKALQFLAKTGSLSEINDVIKDLPHQVQLAVRKAKTEKKVLRAIRPHMGVKEGIPPTVPFRYNPIPSRVLGGRGYMNPKRGAAGGYAIYEDETRLGKLFRREAAEQTGGGIVLDTADPHKTVHNVRQLLDTLGADKKETDSVLSILMHRGHQHDGINQAAAKINEITKRRLVEIGYAPEDVDEIMKPIMQRQLVSRLFDNDVVGNPMARMDEGWWMVPDGQGGHTAVFKPNAAHEAQFSNRSLVLPSIREYRQVTSRVRVGMENSRVRRSGGDYIPLGFDVAAWEKNRATWLRYRLDQGMSAWRNMALLRIGWPLRVLPDEALRVMASGYGNMFTDASHYVAAVVRGDMTTATGDSVADWVRIQGGFGTGGFSRGARPSVVPGDGTIPNVPRDLENAVQLSDKNWVIEPTRRPDGTINQPGIEGLAHNIVVYHESDAARLIIENGVDDAMEILWPKNGQPSKLLQDIAKDAADDNLFASAVHSRKALRAKLEQIEAQIARFSGGDFYYRQVVAGESTGRWLDKRGQLVETYEFMEDGEGGFTKITGPELDRLLRVRDIPGRSKATTVEAKRRMLMEADGHPFELTQLSPKRSNYTVDLGAPRVHGLIARGEDPGELADIGEFIPYERESVAVIMGLTGPGVKETRRAHRVEGYVFHGTDEYFGLEDIPEELVPIVAAPEDFRFVRTDQEGVYLAREQGLPTLERRKAAETLQDAVDEQRGPFDIGDRMIVVRAADMEKDGPVFPVVIMDPVEVQRVLNAQQQGGQLVSGGLTHDLRRALNYAEGSGRVRVYRIEDLAPEVQEALEGSRDVERVIGPASDWRKATIDEEDALGVMGWWNGQEVKFGDAVLASESPRHFMSMTIEEAEEALRRGSLFEPETPVRMIEESMNRRKFMKIEERLPEMYDEAHPMPDTAPRAIAGVDTTKYGTELVNALFRGLGATPTQKLLRHPFFATRWADEMARLYLWAPRKTREGIEALVKTNNMSDQFNVFLKRQLRNRGMKSVPEEGFVNISLEQADEMARFNSLEHVRELLYDLTKTNNFWDSMRLITPFGEAWYEVISRWAQLFNPWGEIGGVVQGGQAIRNIRRPWQVGKAAQQEGWFDEDEFGQEVFNVPLPWGQYEYGGMRMAAQLDPSRLFFVDPSNPRSTYMPSFGPVAQIPGAIADPFLPQPLNDIMRELFYGEFQPPDVSTLGQAVGSIVPTAYRRLLEQIAQGEFRTELAGTTHQVYNGLCGSGDPLYNCNTDAGSRRAAEEAQRVGGQLGWLRVLNAVTLPGQPQYRSQIDLAHEDDVDYWQSLLGTDDQEFWVNSGVLREEYRTVRELFGSDDEAWSYMMNRYGIDATDFVPSTRQAIPTAVTKQAYEKVKNNPAITKYTRFTQMAFAPGGDGDLYVPQYRKTLREGRRERLGVQQMRELQSATKGAIANARLEDLYDKAVAAIEADGSYQGRPRQKAVQLQALQDWKERERDVISTQFLYWGPDADPVLVSTRPKFGQFVDEIRTYADPTSPNYREEANAGLSEVDPEMVAFLEEVMLYWNRAEQISQDRGNTTKWWRIADIERELDPTFEVNVAENIRNWFINGLNQAASRIQDDETRNGAIWVTERIFTPLLEGYDFEDPIILDIAPPPIIGSTSDEPETDTITEQRVPEFAP